MNSSSVITLEEIIERCLAKHFGQNDAVKALISDDTYQISWDGMIKWIKNELDLGRAVKIPNIGLISMQTYEDDSVIYFKFSEHFLEETDLIFEELDIREVRYPTVLLNYHKIKVESDIDQNIMTSAIQNLLMEIADIFQSFDNFEMDLAELGKFFVDEKNLRFMPFTRTQTKKKSKKLTIKNMIEIHMKKNEAINSRRNRFRRPNFSGVPQSNQMSRMSGSQRSSQRMGNEQSANSRIVEIEPSHHSFNRSLFSHGNSQAGTFTSPVRRLVKPPDEEMLMNEMFGAGTDPLALNQNFSVLAQDAGELFNSKFVKPAYAKIRCPPVIDRFSRTLAAPVASQYNSLSASSRIALFYSVATKYLYFDSETNGMAYLKIKENQTKLTANEELLQAVANPDEEIKYILDQENNMELAPKVEAKRNCFDRYKQYIFEEIPREIVAPIRQYWITNILDLIPANYRDLDQMKMESIIDDILNEINEDYYVAIKKSIMDYILKEDSEKLRIGILERFDPPEEYGQAPYKGVVIDDEWVETISKSRANVREKLVSYCQGTLSIIRLWEPKAKSSYFDLPPLYRKEGKLYLHEFAKIQESQTDSIITTIRESWIPDVAKIYQKDLDGMNKNEIVTFFRASASLMSCQTRELIYKSLRELRDFMRLFKKKEGKRYLSPIECIENDTDPMKMNQKSFLKISMKKDPVRIRLNNDKDEIKSEFNGLIDKVVESSEKLPLPEKKISRTVGDYIWNVNQKKDELVLAVKKEIDQIIDYNMEEVEKVSELFEKYQFLITDKKKIEREIEEETKQEGYQKKIDNFKTIIREIEDDIPSEIHMSLALVDCKQIKKDLVDICREYIDKILKKIKDNTFEFKGKISEDIDDMVNRLQAGDANAHNYEEIKLYIDQIEKEIKTNIESEFKKVVDWIKMLYDNEFKINKAFLEATYRTADKVHKIEQRIEEARNRLDHDKAIIEKNLKDKKETYQSSYEDLKKNIQEVKRNGNIAIYKQMAEDVKKIDTEIKTLQEGAEDINTIEEKIGFRVTKFNELDEAAREFMPYKDLWEMVEKWENKFYKKWYSEPIFEQDTDDVLKKCNFIKGNLENIRVTFENMDEPPDNSLRELRKFIKKVDEFTTLTPLLVSLSARGMQERHWKEISMICSNQGIDMKWNENSDYSLADAHSKEMLTITKQLGNISTRANREFQNYNLLEEMEAEWKDVDLRLKEWNDLKSAKTYIIQGDTVEELNILLEDHIIKTQTMKGSSSAKVFEGRINNWDTDLSTINKTLEVWVKVQTNWLYLQPIFSSPDIKQELVNEATKFEQVDDDWRKLMTRTLKHPRAMEIAKETTLEERLKGMLEKLEEVQKRLNDYLNKKREEFPRFYFLGKDSLIEVLSEARDPKKIQKFIKILFGGIQKLIFDDKDEILGVESPEGEVVDFEETVETESHDGKVEKWLANFEETLRFEVRRFIENSFEDYKIMERDKFVLDRPGMAVLNVNMTKWTYDTEKAIIEGGPKGLANLKDTLNSNLEKIVKLVKVGVSKLNRCTLESLIVLDVHNRTIILELIDADVQAITDFEYESQLRYYWDQIEGSNTGQEETIAKVISYNLEYAYEYLGNSSRLVITPLTDRCYRTLCGAIGLFYGGAPEGPAGTGKTETVKDLAKALARPIVVFNCGENLNYRDMARFFKGLASTGSWSCFDEFNRIKLEVLSVIAQQLQSIQNALKEGKTEFFFVDTKIKLKSTCNVFITMNPAGNPDSDTGYAGRNELPDNLKALFRTVAMMVPDYSLIAEIRLYSFGFIEAPDLARKIVTTYKLCSEQIAYKKHYDYGMRAVNSVLKAAGNLRKKDSEGDEYVQVLRAINEVNEAKFLSLDLPLFKAITSDLFPDTVLPEIDFKNLLECLNEVIKEEGLQPEPYFLEKVIQLYQMILVRHGLMIVGEAFSGKSTAITVLASALGKMQDKRYGERRVQLGRLNPKSCTNSQLYGITSNVDGEWKEGVLPVIFKRFANSNSKDRKWMWFDGPVDAIWIEDMNTVFDSNKKLCLSNGDIFYMSDSMNLICEPKDLKVASPATVSRVGMVYLEPHMMGWMYLYKSWKLTLPPHFEDYVKEDMDVYFITVLTPLLNLFEKKVFGFTAPTIVQNIVYTLLKIADTYIRKFDEVIYDAVEFKQRKAFFDMIFAFATVWSAGATVTNEFRQKFDTSLRRFANSADKSVPEEFKKAHRRIKLPDSGKTYNFVLDYKVTSVPNEKPLVELQWKPWSDSLLNTAEISKDIEANQIIVETVDSVRYTHLLHLYMSENLNSLACGPTGTGKTIYIKKLLSELDKTKFLPLEIGFSAQTTAKQIQDIIDGTLKKVKKGTFGPPSGKKMILFVDDLNMPKKEQYGAQPPIELLRQMIDQGGWYDLSEKEKAKPFKKIIDVVFMSAMGPPGDGRNFITPRFQRHLCLLSFTSLDESEMMRIFQTIMNWKLNTGEFVPEIKTISKQIVKATFQMYQNVCENFLPMPSKSHYLFNLRDFSRVIMGICMTNKDSVQTKEMMIKLWIHEIWRVFSDRLNSEEDRVELLLHHLKPIATKVYGENYDALLFDLDLDEDGKIDTLREMRGLIFSDVLYPGTMKDRPYELINDQEKLYRVCNGALKSYDSMSKKPLNIVLFNFAVEHLLIISRILKQPGGNGLLVGVGGSGRRSLTKLTAKIAANELFQISLGKDYNEDAWRDDLKAIMKKAGKGDKTVFLFSDNQIKYETFIEHINNLLNNGEVPNLFPSEELGEILEIAREVAKENNVNIERPEDLFSYFVETVKKHLHVILCFSPLGTEFKDRIRMFPSLVNCCTIDWFFEWPDEALNSVAQKFLSNLPLKPDIIEKCVVSVQNFHKDTVHSASKFLSQLGRHYYVTPTSYIEMINQFKALLQQKTDEIRTLMDKYKNGYQMIIDAEESVTDIQKYLTDMVPEIEKSKVETEANLELTNKAKAEAEVIEEKVSKEKVKANKIQEKAKFFKDQADAELAKVLPAIKRAKAGLEKVNPQDFEKLKGPSPPLIARLVFEALCYIMVPAKDVIKVKNNDTLRNEPDYWQTTQKKMLIDHKGLIKRMKVFNENNNVVSEKIFKKLSKFFKKHDAALERKKVEFSSVAILSIFDWTSCQLELYPAEINARPKREAKESAEKELSDANKLLAEKEQELKVVTDRLDDLNENLRRSMRKKADLEEKYKRYNEQLVRAEALIQNLGEEKGRWKELSEEYEVDLFNITGDVLVSAGLISYSGPFTSNFRSKIIEKWANDVANLEIPGSEIFNFVRTMGEPVKVRQWQIDGLPSDSFSTENAIIIKKAKRWALCIDPQQQANKWIKKTYQKVMDGDKKLKILKMDNRRFMEGIEECVKFGKPCLIENVGVKLDSSLNPVLLKQITTTGGMPMIKIGGNDVDYNHEFFLVLTTKHRNPHYLPDVSTKVTIINFMITKEGLADQLLATIVSKERPELEKEKNRLIEESAANKADLQNLENKILEILQLPKSQLLEDEKAIDILKESKKKSNEINEKQKISDKTEAEIDAARKNYVEISQEASCLFFVITDLGEIDPMYQYSLNYFLDLYVKAIEISRRTDESIELVDRLSDIKNEFLYSLYLNISRSLFVKDKLLFSFLLSVRLKEFKGEIKTDQYTFLITGAVGAVENLTDKPKKLTWLKEKNWVDICRLSEFGGKFQNFHMAFMQNYDDWKRIYDSKDPSQEPFPEMYENTLNDFEKLLVMRCIRMEKIKLQIQQYVIDNLGKKYADIPPFKLEEVYKDSSPRTPLIFILTPGVDPYNSLFQFAEAQSISLNGISLGQGQGETALELIDRAMNDGSWVVLQNCHLAEFFMQDLEIRCDRISQGVGKDNKEVHPNFRLWLTSYPCKFFPSSILENGVKMTNEPPSGLKNNLNAAFSLDDVSNDLRFNVSPNLKAYRRLVFSLCFFHSVIQERRKYGALGWNIAYGFTESDLRISVEQLYMFIEKSPSDIPLDALTYLTGQCNYGGRVTDDKDRRLLLTLLNDYYNEDAYTIENYSLAPGFDDYFIPNGASKVDYLAYIDDLPLENSPGVLGFHPNASITKEIQDSASLLNALLKCQNMGGSGGGGFGKEKVIDFIDLILKDFPEEFDVKEARKKYPNMREESMNTVLVQELAKFNSLIHLVRQSLYDIKRALQGLIILSFELEEAANYISLGKVPKMWMNISYATLKPLGGYIKNLIKRVDFFSNWVENGIPFEFWLGGFYSAQGFITGIMQNYARKYKIAIDELEYDMEVMPDKFAPESPPEDGAFIYGMYLEGAKFNFESMMLDESDPKILFTKCPKILMKPSTPDDVEEFQHYLCPLYLTSVRFGQLLTTGHSTNYVMSLKIPTDYDESHWIKRGVAALTQLDD